MAATIGWMLCVLATLFGIVMSLVTMFVANSMEGGMFSAVSRYLLITACLTGVLSVALIPLVRAVRLDRPPAVIERTAVLLAITPWLILGWLFWRAT